MKKTVLIELDKARNLRLGSNQFAMLQDLGIDLNAGNTGFRELRAILYVGLSWEDKNLTLEQVGDLMDEVIFDEEKGMNYIVDKVTKCVENFAAQRVGKH